MNKYDAEFCNGLLAPLRRTAFLADGKEWHVFCK